VTADADTASGVTVPGSRAPRVTVLMTVYNDERYVGEAVESILAQTFGDFELVIVDDGSTDRTPEVLQRYRSLDARLRVLTQPNAGTAISANLGLSRSRGEYIARIDSDDISLPERLALEVDYLDRHPEVALVGGGAYLIDSVGNVIGRRNITPRYPKLALRSRCIYQQSDVMFRREVVLGLGGYRARLHGATYSGAEDYDLWLRISDVAEVGKLPQIIGKWRINPSGYTLARAAEQRQHAALVRRLARQRRRTGVESRDPTPALPTQQHRQPVPPSAYALWVGLIMLQDGRSAEARRYLAQSLEQRWTARAFLGWLATASPRWALSAAVRVRDAYLNYRFSL
jgi:glycosyltransferase involved in cell wall biosynthesis